MFTLADLKETKVYQEAFAEGEFKQACEIAKNMIDSGIAIDQITKFTGLTAEQIHQLQIDRLE